MKPPIGSINKKTWTFDRSPIALPRVRVVLVALVALQRLSGGWISHSNIEDALQDLPAVAGARARHPPMGMINTSVSPCRPLVVVRELPPDSTVMAMSLATIVFVLAFAPITCRNTHPSTPVAIVVVVATKSTVIVADPCWRIAGLCDQFPQVSDSIHRLLVLDNVLPREVLILLDLDDNTISRVVASINVRIRLNNTGISIANVNVIVLVVECIDVQSICPHVSVLKLADVRLEIIH